MSLRTASIAEQDIVDAATWVDQQQRGKGSTFLNEVRETAAAIVQAPLACPTLLFGQTVFKSPLRWRSVGHFPYVAIFTYEQGEVLIVGVLHNRRDLETILRARVGTI
jgi:plasmid stabilization system protein ParE